MAAVAASLLLGLKRIQEANKVRISSRDKKRINIYF
ncbi:MAG: hypothetical protein ACI94D_002259, partial [Neolewinella sp.]